jgi:hypothetical protein
MVKETRTLGMGRRGPLYNTAAHDSDSDCSSTDHLAETTQEPDPFQYLEEGQPGLSAPTPPKEEKMLDIPEEEEADEEDEESDAHTEPAPIQDYLEIYLNPEEHEEIPFYGETFVSTDFDLQYATRNHPEDHPWMDIDHPRHEDISWANCVFNYCLAHLPQKAENDAFPYQHQGKPTKKVYLDAELSKWTLKEQHEGWFILSPDPRYPEECQQGLPLWKCDEPRCQIHYLEKARQWHEGKGKRLHFRFTMITRERLQQGPKLPTAEEATHQFMDNVTQDYTRDELQKISYKTTYKNALRKASKNEETALKVANKRRKSKNNKGSQ